jgi:hypothetical protein
MVRAESRISPRSGTARFQTTYTRLDSIVTRFTWLTAGLLILIVVLNTAVGFDAVSHTQYRSAEQVFEDFLGGPIRLLFPLVIVGLGTWSTAARLTHRQLASTRTRTDVRLHILRTLGRVVAQTFIAGFAFGLLNWVCAFMIVPAVEPEVINPAAYNLHSPASILADAIRRAPLSALLHDGPFTFALGVSAWLAVNAAVFAALGLFAVYVVRRPVIALLVPFALYIFESVVLQVLGIPGASFLISSVFPTGLQSYDLTLAVIPIVALAAVTIVGFAALVTTSPRNSRFS